MENLKTPLTEEQQNLASDGTSFHNTTIKARPNDLMKILGEPDFQENDGSDKVNMEWNRMLEDGSMYFTVYDWKEYRALNLNRVYTWHIGGRDKKETDAAAKQINSALSKL